MGHGEARRGGMWWRGRAGETEGEAKRVKWNGRAGMEQKARDGTRRSMTERNGAEERQSGNGRGSEGAEGPD